MSDLPDKQRWPGLLGHRCAMIGWTLACILLVSACEPSQEPERREDEEGVRQPEESPASTEDTGPDCSSLEKQLADLRAERDTLHSKRDDVRARLADLEKATKQLEAFEPALKSTTVHIYPSKRPPPREISGHIKNGTDQTVAVMHLHATFEPASPDQAPIEREVAYELHEPIEAGETDHSPYGQQLIDAFPDIETDVWVDGTLELDVRALEGPDGEILWDRRDRDPVVLESRLDTLRERMTELDTQLAETREALESCP